MKKNAPITHKNPLWEAYEAACLEKDFSENPYQREVLCALQNVRQRLEAPSFFSHVFKRPSPKGLYIWGEVGRGKTFLMDLFYQQIESTPKLRVHFHEFMKEIHQTLHESGLSVSSIAKIVPRGTILLCFDEFQVTNIADAMLMSRLFQALFAEGVAIVMTSNTPPEKLYEKGLHQERFLPFIALLHNHMDVVHLQGDVDYRRCKVSLQKPYFTPCNEDALSQLQTFWDQMTEGALRQETVVKGQGPSLTLEGLAKGVAWANFDHLCRQSYGRSQYLALAETIHTLILWGIPQMSPEDHNEALRFTTLIDILYDKGIWLVAAADVGPEYLYQQGGSFDRTVSRLYEMQHG